MFSRTSRSEAFVGIGAKGFSSDVKAKPNELTS
jgi:hypothetical protein